MKRTVCSLLFLLAAGLITLRSLALAQDAEQPGQLHGYYTYGQLRGVTTEQAIRSGSAATSVPCGPTPSPRAATAARGQA